MATKQEGSACGSSTRACERSSTSRKCSSQTANSRTASRPSASKPCFDSANFISNHKPMFKNHEGGSVPSLNHVMLIGHLGADPELRHTPKGTDIATFRMATTKRWKDADSGERRERTE